MILCQCGLLWLFILAVGFYDECIHNHIGCMWMHTMLVLFVLLLMSVYTIGKLIIYILYDITIQLLIYQYDCYFSD